MFWSFWGLKGLIGHFWVILLRKWPKFGQIKKSKMAHYEPFLAGKGGQNWLNNRVLRSKDLRKSKYYILQDFAAKPIGFKRKMLNGQNWLLGILGPEAPKNVRPSRPGPDLEVWPPILKV